MTKDINIYIPVDGQAYISQWSEFSLSNRFISLGGTEAGKVKVKTVTKRGDKALKKAKALIAGMSESEKRELLEKLKNDW